MCLAVKADAYGHGIVEIGKAAAGFGVDYLAVATVDEAVDLRRSGVSLPILLYSLPTPEELPSVIEHAATPVVSDLEIAQLIQDEARRADKRVDVHLKIDTGMGRIGCRPEEAAPIAERLGDFGNLRLAGVSTHFATADSASQDQTRDQIARFNEAIAAIRGRGIDPGIVHAANSGGVLQYPEAWYDMIRPGILAYGYRPSDAVASDFAFTPVMELRSKVIHIKEIEAGSPVSYGATWHAPQRTFIGTIPVGYGDGYSRLLSNRGSVFIGGRTYPIVGRVCMDHIMVDLGPRCEIDRFADVTLFGPNAGGPDADQLAHLCGTIAYEITCAVTKRVPRIYVD